MRFLPAVSLFAFVWGGALVADDPNPGRNRVAEAEDLPVTWDVPSGEGVLWSADLGTVTYGGPTIAGGLIVVGTNNERPRDPAVVGDRGVVMAFDRRDGGFRWQITHEKLEAGDANDWPLQGVCSTPSFDGERLYYVSNRGEVVAANLDGGVDWSFDMVGEWGVFPKHMAASTPLAVGNLVFVSTSNGVTDDGRVPAPEAPSFAALERATGRPVWRDGSPGAALVDGQWGSPSYGRAGGGDQAVFPGGDGWLYGFEPTTGRPLWRFDGNSALTSDEAARGESRNVFVATPVLHEGMVFAAVGRDPEVSLRRGVVWAVDAGGRGDVTSGGVRWRFEDPDLGRAIATVAVVGGIVYTADLNGFLFAIDASTGEKLWTYDALAPFWSSPLVADGKVYAGDTEGDVAVLRAGRTLEVLAENVMPQAVYASPSTDGSGLYVATSDTLYALRSRGSARFGAGER
ncbi:MAG: PQQ-binding-like beta-propeller repeat protein [Acidobacteriota bacterium]|nr:PQQ-binding-like beta-propeller repeat protein [Acidobacteriota bacterium]